MADRSKNTSAHQAIELELFTNRFAGIAREMGERLQRTALSTNVKERLDFSCALLDPTGALVVNAPHIPVHLGALGLCVRKVAAALPLEAGDVVVTNHPAYGGSHLPDVTVIAPVYEEDEGGALLGYVANRAHHAEIGGSRPGSMPPGARSLAEEGVVIPPTYLARGGVMDWKGVHALLIGGPYPSRSPDENMADLAAAVASCHHGAVGLRRLAAEHGVDKVAHLMATLKEKAAKSMAAALARQGEGRYHAVERLDDGSPIAVTLRIATQPEGRAVVDFTGSGEVHPGNLNAPPAVVRSAVLYVLRLLLAEDLPLNEGLLEPVEIRLPAGMLNPPFPEDPAACPAVVGGNVETSQRLVDTLLKALGLMAGSQGTMNNLLFGNDRFGYYETICGGTGAGPGFDGTGAVHSHMTNTRITDPEVLEHRYPVRLERFAVRRSSGGAGLHRGGDGAVREITFLEPVELSLLSQHRSQGPFGLKGGAAGAPGRQRLVRVDGTVEELPGIAGRSLAAGDRLVLETPGGGGWGEEE